MVWGTVFIFHLCHMHGHSPPDLGLEEAAAGVDSTGSAQSNGGSSSCSPSFLPASLVRVLSDPGVLLAGVGIGGDVCRLEKEYEQLRACGVKGIVDLSEVAKRKVRILPSWELGE